MKVIVADLVVTGGVRKQFAINSHTDIDGVKHFDLLPTSNEFTIESVKLEDIVLFSTTVQEVETPDEVAESLSSTTEDSDPTVSSIEEAK